MLSLPPKNPPAPSAPAEQPAPSLRRTSRGNAGSQGQPFWKLKPQTRDQKKGPDSIRFSQQRQDRLQKSRRHTAGFHRICIQDRAEGAAVAQGCDE